eukprot:scaffold15486_cov111-Isochrysis_galbana.AAC.6
MEQAEQGYPASHKRRNRIHSPSEGEDKEGGPEVPRLRSKSFSRSLPAPTPTLPRTDRQSQSQRARPPKLIFPIIMCPGGIGWARARHRRLEPSASTNSARASFTSVAVASVLAVRACSAERTTQENK